MKIITKKKEKKILEKECWNLDYELVKWLNEHLKVYLEDASKMVDLTFHKYTYKKKKMTQEQVIKRLIEITGTLLGSEDSDYWDIVWYTNVEELTNEMYDLLKLIHFSLWW
jgi:enoyl reductase-like protein